MSENSKLQNFWEELRKRNVVKALIFYCVSSWLIIQFVATTFPYLNLPKWSVTVVIITLLIGLPIVLVISWIYEITGDGWKKTDALTEDNSTNSSRGKKLNRLTIIVLGAAVVFLLIDKFILNQSVTVVKDQKTEAIAVFPFAIQGGPDIQYLSEGMVDLVSSKLDALPGMYATDPNVVLSRVKTEGLDNRNPKSAGEAASEMGANRVILGSITQVSDQIQVKISKYNNKGESIGKTIIEQGTLAQLYKKVDNIIRRLVAEELEEQGSEINSEAILTSNKMESMVPFLEGIKLRRAGKYEASLNAFRESIEADSTFTLGYYQYIESATWLPSVFLGDRRVKEYLPYYKKLKELSKGLTGKTREMIDAELAFANSDISSERRFRALLEKYGESREILNNLAESIYHHRAITGGNPIDAKPYFERSIELDPTNEELLNHLIDIAEHEGDLEALEKYANRLSDDSEKKYGMLFKKFIMKDTVTDEELRELSTSLTGNFSFLPDRKIDLIKGLKLADRVKAIDKRFAVTDRYFKGIRKAIGGQHRDMLNSEFAFLRKEGSPQEAFFAMIMQAGFEEIPLNKAMSQEIMQAMQLVKGNVPQGMILLEPDYVMGYLHLLKGDQQAVAQSLQTIRSYFRNNTQGAYGKAGDQARLLYYNLAGIRDYMAEDYERSMIQFDSAVSQVKGVSLFYASGLAKPRHLHRAEYLVKQGEHQKALTLYENSLNNGFVSLESIGATWGFNVYRIAQMHDELGNKEQAIGYYNKLLEAYQNPDAMYQPWVKHASERLSVLVGGPEQGLKGEIN